MARLHLFAITWLMSISVSCSPAPYGLSLESSHNNLHPRFVPTPHPEDSPQHAVGRPMMGPHMDPHHAAHLTPSMSTTHWYKVMHDNDENKPMAVRVDMFHNYPVVVLDHSLHVADVHCLDDENIHARFITTEAYRHAQSVWPDGEDLVAVTSAVSCSPDGQNTFHHVLNITYDDATTSVKLRCNRTDMHSVADGYNIEFGQIEPSDAATANNTISSSNATSVGTLPVANGTSDAPTNGTSQGYPAVAPGPDFDQRLDDLMGYYSTENLTQDEILSMATGIEMNGLQKRGLFDFIGSVVDNVVSGIKGVVNQAVNTVITVANIAVAVVSAVVNVAFAVVQLAATGQYSANVPINFDSRVPDTGSPSPFAATNNYNLFSYRPPDGSENFTVAQAALAQLQGLINEPSPEPGIDIWCVDCRFKGSFVAAGSIQASLSNGVSKALVTFSGDQIEGNIGIGVDAFAMYNIGSTKDLYVLPLGGWSIPGIIQLGPRLVLSAATDLTVSAMGQLYVAYNLKWDEIRTQFDFKTNGGSSQGWTPQIQSTVRAAGSVAATASLGLPMTVNFNLAILNTFRFDANVSNIPALVASSALSLSNTGAFPCQGLGVALNFVDNLQLSVTSFQPRNLEAYNQPIASTCISVPLPTSTSTVAASKLRREEAVVARQNRRSNLPSSQRPAKTLVTRQANANQSNFDPENASPYPVKACDLWDTTRAMQMHPNVNGNLYLNANQTGNITLLTGDNSFYKATHPDGIDVVYGDKNQRVLHYYPDMLSSLGVSRLRLATWQNLPKSSHIITMAMVPTGNGTQEMLMGMDPQGRSAWIFCCGIEGEANKMFLVSNWTTGAATLQSPEMQSVVTGGPAYACLPIAMTT